MEISEQLCRLCRQESEHLESLQGYRDGLPISVIIMIICPVKIKPKDELPKFVCGDCLEVVLSAYKLREDSLESDRYFRENVETRFMNEEQEISIKLENEIEFAEALPLPSVSTFQPPRKKIKITSTPAIEKTIDEDSDNDDDNQNEELDKRFDDKPKFTCHFCGRSLIYKIDLEKHLKVHEDKRDLNKNSNIDSETEEITDPWRRMFKTETNQLKYANYVRVKKISSQPKKRRNKSSDQLETGDDETTDIAHVACLVCDTIVRVPLGTTSNVIKHLKVSKCKKQENNESN